MRICTFEGCERKHHALGLCAAHDLQQRKGKPLTPIQQWKGPRGNRTTGPGTSCTVKDCGKTVHSGGLCAMHRMRMKTHGDLDTCTTNRYIGMTERFWMKVQKGPGCWNWQGSAPNGYGKFRERHNGKSHIAHRLAYQLLVGPIPEGMLLDHRCRNTLCVNPDHLRPVTHKQNMEHQDGAHVNNKSTGVRGVSRNGNRYVVTVGHHGKRINGGSFQDLQEAAEAARQLRLSLFTHSDLDRKTE